MLARFLFLVVLFVALLLAAVHVRAEDYGPTYQDLWGSTATANCGAEVVCGPTLWFQADWLWAMREGAWRNTRNIIGGPDATTLNDLPGFSGNSGYRLQGGIRLDGLIFEGIHTDLGGWDTSLARSVDGVTFNTGLAGDWLGRNFVNAGTFFGPLFNAASLTVPVATSNDQSGLGPSTSFTTDPRPVLTMFYHSELRMTEANVKLADPFLTGLGGGIRLGVGYVHGGLNELAQVSLAGTFRAVSNVGGPTLSLPDAALTAQAGGNLQLLSGGATGFSDGTDGTGIPSQLVFAHATTTSNQLNGMQLLLDGNLLAFHRWDLGGSLKAGIFDNFARGTITETYSETDRDLSVYGRNFENSAHQLAFMGGVGVNVGYHFNDYLALRGGYDVLFFSGLALAQDQLNGVNGSLYQVQTNGSTMVHALHLGLELAY